MDLAELRNRQHNFYKVVPWLKLISCGAESAKVKICLKDKNSAGRETEECFG